ncbi:conserved repeat domain protein, partial [Rhizobium sp. PDO1-076]
AILQSSNKLVCNKSSRGDQVPYTILVTNNAALGNPVVTITDLVPSGFRYVPSSGSVDGVKRDPTISGRLFSFESVSVPAGRTIEVKLSLLILSSVEAGRHRNFANALDGAGQAVGPDAVADVVVLNDAVFDCSEVIGKVFDDANRDGYQDDGEIGLAGVRLATVTGLLITTDSYGRYHIPCAETPDPRIGSNFILKLDTRTLPTGYSLTSENPRVVRLTSGMMTKLNFGASIGRVVTLAVSDEAFQPDSIELTPYWAEALGTLINILGKEQSTLRLIYLDARADGDLIARRVEEIKRKINDLWIEEGSHYRLEIETRVEIVQ